MAPEPAITIAIVNDYEMVVKGVAGMLEGADGLKVVELDANVQTARPVDIALYDTFSQAQAGSDDVLGLLGNPNVDKVVVFSWNVQRPLIEKALAQGVDGYVSKAATREELVAALQKVYAGEKVYPNGTEHLIEDTPWGHPGQQDGLTAREAEVIALISQGLSNDEIARRSYLSINSVKSYIRSAYRKMGVERRSQAVIWALEHGFATRQARFVRRD